MMTTTPPIDRPKMVDSVASEVRQVKAALFKRFNYDLTAMLRDARSRQSQSGHRIATISPSESGTSGKAGSKNGTKKFAWEAGQAINKRI